MAEIAPSLGELLSNMRKECVDILGGFAKEAAEIAGAAGQRRGAQVDAMRTAISAAYAYASVAWMPRDRQRSYRRPAESLSGRAESAADGLACARRRDMLLHAPGAPLRNC